MSDSRLDSQRREGVDHHKQGSAIVKAARKRLEASSHFHGRAQAIHMRAYEGTLVLKGHLPSFYLKQILQTVLKDVEGVEAIENQVDVFLPTRN